jgi:Protein of unknown function (DUF2516)
MARVNVFAVEGWISIAILVVLIAVKAFAFVSSLMFSGEAYSAGDKLSKPAWVAILGLGLAAQLLMAGSPLSLIHLAFTIAAFVYLADVRPALSGLTRR